MHRREEDWLKYTDFTELKKITGIIYSSCSNYSFFFKSFEIHCCLFYLNNTFTAWFIQVVRVTTAGSHVTLHGIISCAVSANELFRSSKDLASLVVCN